MRKESNFMRTAATITTKALLDSFEVSHLIGKNSQSKILLLPAAMEMYKMMRGGKYGEVLK
jgi:hypothetical protein